MYHTYLLWYVFERSIVSYWHIPCQFNYSKNNQMRIPSLLSGPKNRKAYFEASNPKVLLQSPPWNLILMGVYEVHFWIWNLKVGFTNFWSRIQIKGMDFSFDCLYLRSYLSTIPTFYLIESGNLSRNYKWEL